LIHAGTDYDAWCEWDIDFWFEQGNIGKQVTALRLLLGKEALTSPAANTDSPLIKAIQASREGQAELSDTLGERVRQAVELLIQKSNLDSASLQDLQINNRHIYIAASRMIMRCVVILFAEARNLLPRDNPIYNSAYSLQGLREQLEHSGGGQATDRLRNQYSAFPRLLALFRLVYEGCAHEAMPIPCYGGGLFAPGNKETTDPILRALSRFENNSDSPSDAVVHQILKLLTRSKVKVRQGKQNTWVEAPVDFSDLSSEYIGILYEGLLDFELRQADEDDPIIFLDLGDQPALPLKRLEAMDEKALASLVEKLKDKAKPETSEDVEEDTEEEAPLPNDDVEIAPLSKGGDLITVGFSETERPSWFRECVKDFPLTVENAEEVVKARLKRYVVERCIYGVDINPLAVELARLSLWVETMDQSLPFSFLDHKIKCGNALIGCWFDRFQDYPVMAWEREGGDANHDKFVHHFREYVVTRGKKQGQQTTKGDKWTAAIKETKNNLVKSELKTILQTLDPSQSSLVYPNFDLPKLPEVIHDEALNIFEELHNLPVYDSEERERRYREKIENSEAIKRLKFAFDTWCAVWFWSGENIDLAPTPGKFFDPPTETREMIQDLANHYQFFHWELEFPDVFAGENGGFDGMVGNPPWEIKKPNSMEFFSNVDPLYRTYGKQEALDKQQEYFNNYPQIEKDWLAYCAELKALSNWTKNVGFPFGDPAEAGEKFTFSRSKIETEFLHELWRNRRNQQIGYADERHPFRFQGSADINTYKMFLELSLLLLRQDGRFGMIVPSGVYTDKGATVLRTEFLFHCQWEWLFGFENRDKIFAIDSRYKFCPVILCKGGETEAIKATFMQRSLTSWEKAEDYVLAYPRQQVEQFSPYSKAILEIRSERDLEILKKIYSNSVLLGDDSPSGWGIKYSLEFMMNTDSKLFPPRPKWENKGYHPDEYGHWLKGNWQPYSGSSSILQRPQGLILSADGTSGIKIDEVEDIALPLYQGVMIWQFDFSASSYLSGASNQAKWQRNEWNNNKILSSQFLMSRNNHIEKSKTNRGIRLIFRDISNATNQRSIVSAIVPDFPCSNKNPILTPNGSFIEKIKLCSILNSFVLDFALRNRFGGTTLNYFILQ